MLTLKGLRQNPASYPVMDYEFDDSYCGSVVRRNQIKNSTWMDEKECLVTLGDPIFLTLKLKEKDK